MHSLTGKIAFASLAVAALLMSGCAHRAETQTDQTTTTVQPQQQPAPPPADTQQRPPGQRG